MIYSAEASPHSEAQPTLIEQCSWERAQLGDAVLALGRHINRRSALDVVLPPHSADLDSWLDNAGAQLDLEFVHTKVAYPDCETTLRQIAPALLRIAPNHFLLIMQSGRRLTLLAPDGSRRKVRVEQVRQAMTMSVEAAHRPKIRTLLQAAVVPADRHEQATRRLLNEQLADTTIDGCWLVRPAVTVALSAQARHARLPQLLLSIIVGYIAQQALVVVGGWLAITLDFALLLPFLLLIFLTLIPIQMLLGWQTQLLSTRFGVLFRRRLMHGILRLDSAEIKQHGTGHFLGQVMESQAVELLTLGSGFNLLVGIIQLTATLAILLFVTGGAQHTLLLVGWLLFTLLLTWLYFRDSRAWLRFYRRLTGDLLERMLGHRTRLVQEQPTNWHTSEDLLLAHYHDLSVRLDRRLLYLDSVAGNGWRIIGFFSVAFVAIFLAAARAEVVIAIGGILLAATALSNLLGGLKAFIGVANAWDQVRPIFNAAHATPPPPFTEPTATTDGDLLRVHNIQDRYAPQAPFLLDGCDLTIAHGDRILLEGASGSGKTTLAWVLAGLRSAESGTLLLDGNDQKTLGIQQWRKRVLLVPQFHDNHILSESLAFNLLMGRNWPPEPDDLAQAERICRELGLGDLLDQMPAGLQQMVGENGWRLSLGEQSRIFIARALLQQPDLLILDESFAVLDPENLDQAMETVLRHAPTLLVIAHP